MQHRRFERKSGTATAERKLTLIGETKIVDSAEGIVEAITAVTGNVDHGGDLIEPGAFVLDRGLPKMVWSHDWATIIGKTLEAKEYMPGDPALPSDLRNAGFGAFWSQMQLNLDLQEAKDALSAIDFDPTLQWSIGYEALDFVLATEEDEPNLRRRLKSVFVFENSPVAWGMNGLTRTLGVKSLRHLAAHPDEMSDEGKRAFIAVIGDLAKALDVKIGDEPAPETKPAGDDGEKFWPPLDGSLEARREAIGEAAREKFGYDPENSVYVWVEATFEDYAIVCVYGDGDETYYQVDYTIADDGTATLGDPVEVEVVQTITPKSARIDVRVKGSDDDPLIGVETEIAHLAALDAEKRGDRDRLAKVHAAVGSLLESESDDPELPPEGDKLVQLTDADLWAYQKVRGVGERVDVDA